MSNFREVNDDILRDLLNLARKQFLVDLPKKIKNIIFILMKFVKVF